MTTKFPIDIKKWFSSNRGRHKKIGVHRVFYNENSHKERGTMLDKIDQLPPELQNIIFNKLDKRTWLNLRLSSKLSKAMFENFVALEKNKFQAKLIEIYEELERLAQRQTYNHLSSALCKMKELDAIVNTDEYRKLLPIIDYLSLTLVVVDDGKKYLSTQKKMEYGFFLNKVNELYYMLVNLGKRINDLKLPEGQFSKNYLVTKKRELIAFMIEYLDEKIADEKKMVIEKNQDEEVVEANTFVDECLRIYQGEKNSWVSRMNKLPAQVVSNDNSSPRNTLS